MPSAVPRPIYLAQGVPLVNIIDSYDGEERFLAGVDTTGNKKDMPFLYTLLQKYIDEHVDLVVSDGACAGLLAIIEAKHPRYIAGSPTL